MNPTVYAVVVVDNFRGAEWFQNKEGAYEYRAYLIDDIDSDFSEDEVTVYKVSPMRNAVRWS